MLADANHSTAAAGAQPSDINSHRYFMPPLAVDARAVIVIPAGEGALDQDQLSKWFAAKARLV